VGKITIYYESSIKILNDNQNSNYPVNDKAVNQDKILVGRFRKLKQSNWYSFICIADNIRKGAASNAIQIY
jgi:aspartate-semialdehyde dehydrogenase